MQKVQEEKKVKNIEIKVSCCFMKKIVLTGLACTLTLGLFTIDSTFVKAFTGETSDKVTEKSSIERQSQKTSFQTATSDPKKIYFNESTIKIAKYESASIGRAMKVIPSVNNTVPFLKGTKYWIDNTNVAFISEDLIVAKKEGSTWLNVETPNKVRAKVSIKVTPQKDYSRVSFLEKVVKIGLKQNFNVKDYVYPTVSCADASMVVKPNIKYTYRIGNSKLAKVTADGLVQGLAKGGTWLYVKSESGYENRILLNVVTPLKNATSVKLPQTQTVNIREKVKLNATVSPSNSKIASWRIGNKKIATITQTGVVTGITAGGTYAYAKLANGKEVKCLVKVKNPDRLIVDDVNNGGTVNIDKNDSILRVEYVSKYFGIRPQYDYTTLKVKTGNSKIAVANKIGNNFWGYISIKAISSGKTWLHLETTDGVKCKVLLNVKKTPLKKFTIPNQFTLEKKAALYLPAQLQIDGFYKNSVKYRTGNSKIARVDEEGYLIGVSEGKTYLYTECQGRTLKTLVSVKSGPAIKSIKFNLNSSTIDINAKKSPEFVVPSITINPSNAINQKVAFKIGNEKIATIEKRPVETESGDTEWVDTICAKSNGGTYLYATTPNGITTKILVRVTGFDEIKRISVPKVIDINLSKNTEGNKEYDWWNRSYTCTATLNTSYGNKLEDVEVYIGNKSIAEVTYVSKSENKIYVDYVAKSKGGTYLYFKMPNGKIVKSLIKIHW